MPEANGFPPIEPGNISLAYNLNLALDVFQPALHAEPARGEAEIEMGFFEIQPRELRLQVGNVEAAAEERDEEVCLFQFRVQSVLG